MLIYPDVPGNYEHDQTRVTIRYNVLAQAGEVLSDLAVRAAMIGDGSGGFAPATYTPAGATVPWTIRGYRQSEEQPGIWKCDVSYSGLSYQFSFDLSGSDQTVYQSKQTVHKYADPAAPAPIPDCGRAMNQDEKTVHGASIYVPNASWTESLEVPAVDVDGDYRKKVFNIVGHTNDAPFRGCEAGSVLFRGCSGSLSTANPLFFALTLKFSYEANRSVAGGNPITVGNINNVEKKGWEYLWVKYKKQPDPNVAKIVHVPEYVYVERVYDSASFALLNIGIGNDIVWGGP